MEAGLTVTGTDGSSHSSSQQITIDTLSENLPPVADAGPERSVLVNQEFTLKTGELKLVRTGHDDDVSAYMEPLNKLDLGAGPGKAVERKLRGGVVGLVFDARGRPLALPDVAEILREAGAGK